MDNEGQLLVISGFIMAMGMVVLAIMLNSVIYTGNIAYEGSMDTHDQIILYINDLTLRESANAYNDAWLSGTYDQIKYDKYMSSYSEYLEKLSADKGLSVSIVSSTCTSEAAPSKKGTITTEISYSDGDIKSEYTLTAQVTHN